MVSSEHRDWLYVAIPIYFVMLAGSAAWAYKRMERMNHEGVSDKLSSHYLGGRSFGPLLTAGTVFASLFSGYTVVGIPNEAYKLGWYAIRWMPTTALIAFGYYGTGLRLRRASMVMTSVIYLAAQVIALKGTFNSMFEIEADANWPVILIMSLILVFEWVGGLSSVAFTDSIQGLIMLISFIILPIVIKANFGGWSDLDPETYPKPSFYETPSADQQWKFWQFSMINFSFFTLPHFLQRTYAAKDLVSLKCAYSVVVVGPWITMFVGIYIGTVGVQMLDGADVASPFASILEEVMNLGGFSKFIAVIAFTASLAAIMSTADSLIIAVSQLVTVEVLYPMVKTKSPNTLAWMGRFVSFMAVLVALLVGILWKSGISDLGAIQFPITMQAVPAFLFALFATNKSTDVHPWCMAASAWIAIAYVFGIYFGYLSNHEDPAPIDAGVTGVTIQVVSLVLLESARRVIFPDPYEAETTKPLHTSDTKDEPQLLYPNRPAFDIPCTKRFGDRPLTPKDLWQMMEGVHEPITNVYFVAFMLFSVSLVTPLVPAGIPTSSTEDAVVVNGLPWWAFKALLLCIVPYAMSLYAVLRMPNKFPSLAEDSVLEQPGLIIDPDLVDMSNEEMGRRGSYDEPNTMASQRRSSIRKSLQGLGMVGSHEMRHSSRHLPSNDSVKHLHKLVQDDETESSHFDQRNDEVAVLYKDTDITA
ncbi:Sodium/proline symporter [Seminavis robusta]|uniref:Sodium/proline symporter n=1 Tax=Seminavis robusta TaxID=568900 RepID=A0A9N8E7U6_9STRA|nr:Sodium/proline symporter [Seminavis robusta]|eukprot:Sro777_g200980.1 Sodium/proline symporter (701) ;mRNA; f:4745-7112